LGATHKKYRNYEDKYQKEITLERAHYLQDNFACALNAFTILKQYDVRPSKSE
jgi:hypothetical protein